MDGLGLTVFASWFSPADASLRRQVESGKLLVEREGETLDRYDARNLLDASHKMARDAGSRLAPVLDALRFEALWNVLERAARRREEEEKEKEEEEARKARAEGQEEEGEGEMHAKRRKTADKSDSVPSAAGAPPPPPPPVFLCPYETPCDMAVPLSERQHNVIWTLVQFAQRHGQSVVDNARTKQADNPLFGFLRPEHELHSYFEFLRKGLASETLRPRPEMRFFEEIPKLGAKSGALAALVGSEDHLRRTVIDIFVRYCKDYPGVKSRILAAVPEGDERFDFLLPTNDLHEYYQQKAGGQSNAATVATASAAAAAPNVADRQRLALELLKAEGFVTAYDPAAQ